MADEKHPQAGEHSADRLRATVERMEQRALTIPAWKFGTIVFAEHPPSPATGSPSTSKAVKQ
jgi:hypothetical protein